MRKITSFSTRVGGCLALAVVWGLLALPESAFAKPPDKPEKCKPPSSCKGDSGGADVPLYDVTISGVVSGVGGEWQKQNAKWITYKNFDNVEDPLELNLDYFRLPNGAGVPFPGRGESCFEENVELFQGILQKSKGGSAKALFWFEGFTDGLTDVEPTPVLYVLEVFGLLDDSDDWPPLVANKMTMAAWSMSVENEGKEIKNISCLGEGPGPDFPPMFIEVVAQ